MSKGKFAVFWGLYYFKEMEKIGTMIFLYNDIKISEGHISLTPKFIQT
jgi:hypothetical protein